MTKREWRPFRHTGAVSGFLENTQFKWQGTEQSNNPITELTITHLPHLNSRHEGKDLNITLIVDYR